MKFTIDRSKWRIGVAYREATGKGATLLLNTEGFMCCLGQCMEQEGIRKGLLLDTCAPKELRVESIFIDEKGANSLIANEAISINDDHKSIKTVQEKEESLIELFAKHGHEIKFVGEAVNYY